MALAITRSSDCSAGEAWASSTKPGKSGSNRIVALKMILAGSHASPEALLRFKIEAEAIAELQHPHIVQVYDFGERDGRPFFSLEYLDGGSLQQKVDGNPRDPRRAAQLLETLARAIDFAHRHGIVHRDLKPANILFTADGIPKITDFGLAKRIEEDSGQTGTETILGTPTYMAPEQAKGKAGKIGPHTDVYALGAILYDLLSGRPPFKGSTALDTLQQVRTSEPVPPTHWQRNLPRDLETICLKCLQKDPASRYHCAADLADDLARFSMADPSRLDPWVSWRRLEMGQASSDRHHSALARLYFSARRRFRHRHLQARLSGKNEELNATNEQLHDSNVALKKDPGRTPPGE